jgi:hypothetical protein
VLAASLLIQRRSTRGGTLRGGQGRCRPVGLRFVIPSAPIAIGRSIASHSFNYIGLGRHARADSTANLDESIYNCHMALGNGGNKCSVVTFYEAAPSRA